MALLNIYKLTILWQ